jgi:hypothetical protein
MKTLLVANLSTKQVTAGGDAWTPPDYVFGESVTLALRLNQDIDGQTVEPTLDVRNLRAMIGLVDARPNSGTFALQIGPGPQTSANTTAALQHDCAPSAMAAAITAKTAVITAYGAVSVTKADGSWQLSFGTGAVQVPVKVVSNELFPISFGRVSSYTIDSEWISEVRLVQAPVAVAEGVNRVLPDAPSVTHTVAGGTDSGYTWNDVQSLYVPPDFRATYVLKFGSIARTGELSVSDTSDTIQAALVKVLGAGNVVVTNPAPFTARIEFVGALAGASQPLLEVLPLNAPPGDLTFTLDLGMAELAALLRAEPSVTLPLEVRIWTADDDDVVTPQVVFRQEVNILQPVQWPEMDLIQSVDWLRPPSPKDYTPFSPDTVITGQQYYPHAIGDGSATTFAIAHGLATDIVMVWVRENISNGRQLVDGTDFSVRIVDTNNVEITALGGTPPTTNGWLAVVVSAQTVGAFAGGLHVTIAQVTGLQDILDSLNTRVTTLESYVPASPPAIPATTGQGFNITLPDSNEMYPMRFITVETGQIPPKGRPLLPAVHDASAASLTIPLVDPATVAGQVFVNSSGSATTLPGGGGRKPTTALNGGFVASDGRYFYNVNQAAGTTSYYPTDFERELFYVAITSAQFRAGMSSACNFDVILQLLAANTAGQYVLVIEVGSMPSQSTPATTGLNLQDVVWNATPILSQRIVLSEVAITHSFGCTFIRSSDGTTITANKTAYGVTTAASVVPSSADFAIRARLIEWDVENSVVDPRGLVSLKFTAGQLKTS